MELQIEADDLRRARLEQVGAVQLHVRDAAFEVRAPGGGRDRADLPAVALDVPADQRLCSRALDAVYARATVGREQRLLAKVVVLTPEVANV